MKGARGSRDETEGAVRVMHQEQSRHSAIVSSPILMVHRQDTRIELREGGRGGRGSGSGGRLD